MYRKFNHTRQVMASRKSVLKIHLFLNDVILMLPLALPSLYVRGQYLKHLVYLSFIDISYFHSQIVFICRESKVQTHPQNVRMLELKETRLLLETSRYVV